MTGLVVRLLYGCGLRVAELVGLDHRGSDTAAGWIDAADASAREVLAQAFPGRDIVAVPCRPLIWQNGSLHCITMQLPEGLLA